MFESSRRHESQGGRVTGRGSHKAKGKTARMRGSAEARMGHIIRAAP